LSDKEFEINDTIPTYFKVFIDEIELQYFDDFENSKIEDKFIKYCDKIIENIESDLSLTQSHALVKYHKDVHQNGEDVLKDLFEKVKQTSSTSDF
jgi:type I restriction-modification system DNA methylase subunit